MNRLNHFTDEKKSKLQVDLGMHIENYEAEFIKLILQRLGITSYPKSQILHNLIADACHKFNCEPGDYLHMLSTCSDGSPVMEHLIAGITIGETYFFRDKHQMQLLRHHVLPELIKRKQAQHHLSLRIWSAGCSTGEEIYTIAIMLHELLPDLNRWTIRLLGTDINSLSLQKAKVGHYNKWSMRSISAHHQQQYFRQHDNRYMLSAKILAMVDFQYLNLNDDTYPSILNNTNCYDLIICRNVLIYFNNESIARLMKKISLSLIDGGYLLLGASDPVALDGTNLVMQPQQCMLFARHDAKARTTHKSTIAHECRASLPKKKIKTTLSTRANILIYSTSKQRTPALVLCEKAQQAANAGRLEQALTYCQESLALDTTNKETYFILALVLIEQNRLFDAETALRKALYIDRKFVEGHFQLGLLLLKNKQYQLGLKSLRNALAIVTTKEPEQIVPGEPGLSYKRFAEIINKEIELYLMAGSQNNDPKK